MASTWPELHSGTNFNYVWDYTLLEWVKQPFCDCTGGGGGAATIADGADVTQGSINDAAVFGDNPGTVNAHLRGIDAILFDVWDDAANSFRVIGPLTDAELRASAVPVSGNWLTDAQLRAAPVPVSGTVSTGGLTDAELRATPVPVSAVDLDIRDLVFATDKVDVSGSAVSVTGTVSTGGLTDAELRASPVPVTGTVLTGAGSTTTVDNAAGAAAVNIQDGGNSITVDAVNLDIRDLVFASDKVDVSGSVVAAVVSGTVTANQGTPAATANRWPVQITDGTDLALVTAAGEQNVLATAQPGVDIGDVTINNAAGAAAVNIQDGGNSITVDGVFFQAVQPVAGNLTNNNAAPAATNIGVLPARATAAAPSYTEGNQVLLSTTLAGDLRVTTVGTATVTGVVSTKTDLTPSAPTAASVGVSSAQAVAANANRKGLVLVNTSNNARISLGFGSAAVLNSGITLYPQGVYEMDEFTFDLGAVNAIASIATSNLAIQEYTT